MGVSGGRRGSWILVTVGSGWGRGCLWPACRAGWRPVPLAGGRFSGSWAGVFAGQAGALQTVMTASAVRVAVSRPAPGNAGRALILRARCRFRPVMTRLLLIALVRAV